MTISQPTMPTRIVVGITGATGSILGIRVLERLREFEAETHLVISPWGSRTIEHETPFSSDHVRKLADYSYRPNDQSAAISSGSFRTQGMVIAPCSMKTVAGIASGYTQDLVVRAADVVIKENRPLVLLVRESPFSALHLENMLKLAQLGVRIVPPVPAFYNHPQSLDDVVDHIVTRALDQLGLFSTQTPRWDGNLHRRTDNNDEP
jgi:4-hydroxy-3-polyprenylbenzoate decarboxylase